MLLYADATFRAVEHKLHNRKTITYLTRATVLWCSDEASSVLADLTTILSTTIMIHKFITTTTHTGATNAHIRPVSTDNQQL